MKTSLCASRDSITIVRLENKTSDEINENSLILLTYEKRIYLSIYTAVAADDNTSYLIKMSNV